MLFEVTADDIERLGDTDLRTLVGRLCEEEVRKQEFSPAAVTWGGHQNAADGGIDVRVNLPEGSAITGFVPAAASGFQVKAQDMPRQAILDEMAPKGILRPSIAELAAKHGAYIIVSSQGSVADSALQDRRGALREAVDGKVSSGSLTVDFYDRQRLTTWINQHPGLIPWVREKVGRPLSGWRPFGDWSSSPLPVDKPYFVDGAVRLISPAIRDADGMEATDGVNHLREILAKPKGIVRLVGLSGVGKTRLVQALFDDRIGTDPLTPAEAVYTDMSNGPDPVPLEFASQLIHLRQRAVLIIDNCGPDLHQKLAAGITAADAPISLITVEYDINDDEPEHTTIFKLEVASVDLMEKILADRFPAIPEPSRRIIAEFSNGNARIAFALAATAKNGESLANLRDRDLFERLFYQAKGRDQNLLNAAKVCALLYSFDGVTLAGTESELAPLAGLVGLTADELFAQVSELQRRQLVQKRGQWRAMLPHAVAHRLTKLALQDIPFERIDDTIVKGGSERMLRSFSKRIGYLHDDEHAIALAVKWFGSGGLLEPIGKYNELGKALFTNVAPIDPYLTLALIENAATRNDWFFGSENYNRSEIVRVLRSIAYDPALFDRAVSLLKKFVLNPGDDRQDPAKDILTSLFFLYLSGTHATSAQRVGFIRSLLESSNAAESALGLELLRAMLECMHFSSNYSFNFGARSRDYGFNPRKREEFIEWFGQALQLSKAIGMSNYPVAIEVRKHVAAHFSQLCSRLGMLDELLDIADAFAGRGSWPDGWIGARAAIKRLDGKIPESETNKLVALSERLQPTNLADMVRSYALSKEWGMLDIAELEEGDGHDLLKSRERVFQLCTDLGRKLAQDEKQLDTILPEIFAANSHKTFALGQGIASTCQSITTCWEFITDKFFALSKNERNPMMLGGFLEEAMRRNAAEVEGILDKALSDPRMHSNFLYFQSHAGLVERAFSRLAAGLKIETIPIFSYMQLAHGRVHEKLDDEQIFILSRGISAKDGGLDVTGEIIGMRMFGMGKDAPPMSEVLKAAGREFLELVSFDAKGTHFDHLLGVIIKSSIDGSGHEGLSRRLCGRIKDAVQQFKINPWDVDDVLRSLAAVCPVEVLDVLVEKGNDEAETSRTVFRDIRENRGCALEARPDEALLVWAEIKPDTRYAALSQAIRYSDGSDDGNAMHWSPIAEKVIDRAPDPTPVLNIFLDRFKPMSWSGSRAEIMATRIPLLEVLLEHPRPEVIQWVQGKIQPFTDMVARERASESAHDRNRDERFE